VRRVVERGAARAPRSFRLSATSRSQESRSCSDTVQGSLGACGPSVRKWCRLRARDGCGVCLGRPPLDELELATCARADAARRVRCDLPPREPSARQRRAERCCRSGSTTGRALDRLAQCALLGGSARLVRLPLLRRSRHLQCVSDHVSVPTARPAERDRGQPLSYSRAGRARCRQRLAVESALGFAFSPTTGLCVLCLSAAASLVPITAGGAIANVGATAGILLALGVGKNTAISFSLASGSLLITTASAAALAGLALSVATRTLANRAAAVLRAWLRPWIRTGSASWIPVPNGVSIVQGSDRSGSLHGRSEISVTLMIFDVLRIDDGDAPCLLTRSVGRCSRPST
jgi:hypothetical protein